MMSDSKLLKDSPDLSSEVATVRSKVMFSVALAFLLLTAFSMLGYDHATSQSEQGRFLGWFFGILWLAIFIESVFGFWQSADYSWQATGRLVLILLIPPYRLALATHAPGNCIWLPILGRQEINRKLYDRLDRGFSMPMLFIAMLIVPILGIELFGTKYIRIYPSLGVLLDAGTSAIWLAFAFEFILMSTIAEAKVRYVAQNWINLAIILLPLIAFLRGFRIVRLLRLGKAARILKTYRLRGLGMRAWRGVVTLELIELLIHRNPESRLARLKVKMREQEHNLENLRQRVTKLEADILANKKRVQTKVSAM